MSYGDNDSYNIYHNKFGDGPGPYLMGAGTLTGNDVYNLKDEKLGEIKEFMLNMRDGKVSYAVLSDGGFICTLGEKLYAIPFKALQLDTKNKRFILDADIEKIQNAPGFDTEHWPNMEDEAWGDSIHKFYGLENKYY